MPDKESEIPLSKEPQGKESEGKELEEEKDYDPDNPDGGNMSHDSLLA